MCGVDASGEGAASSLRLSQSYRLCATSQHRILSVVARVTATIEHMAESSNGLCSPRDGDRSRFLLRLSALAEGSTKREVKWAPIGEGLVLSPNEAQAIVSELVSMGWAVNSAFGTVTITTAGVEETGRLKEERAGVQNVSPAATGSPSKPPSDAEVWRQKLALKSTEQIENELAQGIYGVPSSPKVAIAHSVLEARREQRGECLLARIEQGEVTTLKERIRSLEGEQRTERNKLRWTRLTAMAAILAALASWRGPLSWAFKWAMGWK
jgi:hypothetical protein